LDYSWVLPRTWISNPNKAGRRIISTSATTWGWEDIVKELPSHPNIDGQYLATKKAGDTLTYEWRDTPRELPDITTYNYGSILSVGETGLLNWKNENAIFPNKPSVVKKYALVYDKETDSRVWEDYNSGIDLPTLSQEDFVLYADPRRSGETKWSWREAKWIEKPTNSSVITNTADKEGFLTLDYNGDVFWKEYIPPVVIPEPQATNYVLQSDLTVNTGELKYKWVEKDVAIPPKPYDLAGDPAILYNDTDNNLVWKEDKGYPVHGEDTIILTNDMITNQQVELTYIPLGGIDKTVIFNTTYSLRQVVGMSWLSGKTVNLGGFGLDSDGNVIGEYAGTSLTFSYRYYS
jgi:hypothetical protein